MSANKKVLKILQALNHIKGISFEDLVYGISNKNVKDPSASPLSKEEMDLLDKIGKATEKTYKNFQTKPATAPRPNELYRNFAEVFIDQAQSVGLIVEGAGQDDIQDSEVKISSGYPQLKVWNSKKKKVCAYVSVKTLKNDSVDSSYRSLYLSLHHKIDHDAFHLVLSFIYDQTGNQYQSRSYGVFNLKELPIAWQPKFEGNNAGMYSTKPLFGNFPTHSMTQEELPLESIAQKDALLEIVSILLSEPIKSIHFQQVVEAVSGKKVLDPTGKYYYQWESILKEVGPHVVENSPTNLAVTNKSHAGSVVQGMLAQSLKELSKKYKYQVTEFTSGYPDFELKMGNSRIYLECKAFSKGTENSSLRTFYFSGGNHIKYDAFHTLIGFPIQITNGNLKLLPNYKLVTLNELSVSLKYEFNSSNKEVYKEVDDKRTKKTGT